jgi:outer membrane protein assembly factor BamB
VATAPVALRHEDTDNTPMVIQFRVWCAASLAVMLGCSSLSNLQLGSTTRWEQSSEQQPSVRSFASLRWRVPLAALTDLDARARSRAAPVVDEAHGVLYAGGLDHGVYAVRIRDGAILWRFQTLGPVEGTGTLDNNTLYIGSGDGALYALNTDNGEMRWRFATTAEVIHPPVVTTDSVYFTNADDSMFAVRRTDGTSRWRYHREPPGGITGGGHAGLLLARGHLFTGFSDGRVVAVDPSDGTATWERDTSVDSEGQNGANEAHRTIDVDTTPVMADGNLFAASYTSGLYALDPEGGGVRWRVESLLNVSSIATDGRHIYATANADVVKLSATDGEIAWRQNLSSQGLQRVMVGGDWLFVPSTDHSMWVLRTRDGEPIGGIGQEGVSGEPFVTSTTIYFETNRSVVYAWNWSQPDPS